MVEHTEPARNAKGEPVKTAAEAEKFLRSRRREVLNHIEGIQQFQGRRQKRTTVEELLQTYELAYQQRGGKSLPQVRSHLKHIREFFGMDRAVAVTTDRLRKYIAFRQEEGAAPATINRELEGLQRAFALALDSGTVATTPKFPSLPEHNARQGFFERGDFQAVLSKIGDSDIADFLEFFFSTGMRPGEIKSLTWRAFDRETWAIRLHASRAKIGQGRVIILDGPLQEIIKRRLSLRQFGCDLIFYRRGKPLGEFRKRWNRACALAGITDKTPYDLRRTAVRNMVRGGVPEWVAMSVSGHKTRAVFDRYNITSEKDLREAVAKTVAYVESLPAEQSVVEIRQAAEMAR